MILGHGIFCPVDTVKNELAEIGVTDLSGQVKICFFGFIGKEKMIPARTFLPQIGVFPLLNKPFSTQDE